MIPNDPWRPCETGGSWNLGPESFQLCRRSVGERVQGSWFPDSEDRKTMSVPHSSLTRASEWLPSRPFSTSCPLQEVDRLWGRQVQVPVPSLSGCGSLGLLRALPHDCDLIRVKCQRRLCLVKVAAGVWLLPLFSLCDSGGPEWLFFVGRSWLHAGSRTEALCETASFSRQAGSTRTC